MGRCADCCAYMSQNRYAIYILTVFMAIYLVDQLNTFCLIASNAKMSQEIGYGDRECAPSNATHLQLLLGNATTPQQYCANNHTLCAEAADGGLCYWKYLGRGLQYQLLAGPLYIVLFSISGIPMGLLSELRNLNRKWFLSVSVLCGSSMALLGGFSTQFWHLAVTRSLIGVFSAACVPFCASIISDYFGQEVRGAAMGFFNFGISIGYSLTYVLLVAVDRYGWRVVYYISSAPGLLLGLVCMVTVREPAKGASQDNPTKALEHLSGTCNKLGAACRLFCSPVLLLLAIGGAIRNGAGFVWAYNTLIFFDEYHPDFRVEAFMSWIPLLFGTISSFGGGWISDRLMVRRGLYGRLTFVIVCEIVSGLLNTGMLMAPSPYTAMGLHMAAYVFGEVWLTVCITVVLGLVPSDLTASSVAVYFFFIQIIGGNMNVLISPLTSVLNIREALIVMFPGMYWLACVFFGLAMCVHAAKQGRGHATAYRMDDDKSRENSARDLGVVSDRNSADLTGLKVNKQDGFDNFALKDKM